MKTILLGNKVLPTGLISMGFFSERHTNKKNINIHIRSSENLILLKFLQKNVKSTCISIKGQAV